MPSEAKIKVKVEGESEYKKALQSLNQESKTLSAQMKAVTSSFDDNTSSLTKATEKSKVLEEQIENENAKLKEHKQMLDKVSAQYGDNSTEALKYKEKVYKSETALNNLNKELNKCQTEMKQTGTSTTTATTKMSAFKTAVSQIDTSKLSDRLNTLSNTLSKTLVAGTGAAVTALVSLGKQSVEAYAEVEQLKGGIETLYGEDAQTLIKNANSAFQTAGMSASTYMETVTKFSASLISSLDGDTSAAVEKADLAITDMSDNVNTFGSDIETVVSAYQGFAKQNYTLLDNLNLGFSGSKEGMQALIDKANEISGLDLDISSFSDIVEAIHIVQEELDVAGKTAEESSSTIQGSIDSAKAAWENLVAGLSDPDSDIGLLVENMMDAAGIALNNLTPVVKTFISNVPKALKKAFPEATDTIEAFEKGLSALGSVIDVLTPVVNGLVSNLGSLFTGGIVVTGISKVTSSLSNMIPNVKELTKSANWHINWNSQWKDVTTTINHYSNLEKALKSVNKTWKDVDANLVGAETWEKTGKSVKKYTQYVEEGGEKVKVVTSYWKDQDGQLQTSSKAVDSYSKNTQKSLKDINSVQKKLHNDWEDLQDDADYYYENFSTNLSSILGGITNIITVATTVAGVIATAYEVWKEHQEKIIEELSALTDEEDALKESVDAAATSIESQSTAFESSLESINSEYSHVESLATELQSLADENGNVKEADQARASFILNELNSALETEYTMTGNQIQNYKDLQTEIYSLIEAKRANAQLSALEEGYEEAIKNQSTAYDDYQEAYLNYVSFMNSEQYKYLEQQKNWEDQLTEAHESGSLDQYNVLWQAYQAWYQVNKNQVAAAQEKNDELKGTYDTAEQNVSDYYDTIRQYESAAQASTQEDWDAVSDIINNGITTRTEQYDSQLSILKKHDEDELAEYQAQKESLQKKYLDLMIDKENFGDDWTDEQQTQLDSAKKALEDFINPSYEETLVANANQVGQDIGDTLIFGTKTAVSEGSVDDEVTDVIDNAKTKGVAEASKGKDVGKALVSGIGDGVEDTTTQNNVFSSAISFCTKLVSKMKKLLKIESPSKVMRDVIGKNIVKGIEVGIEDETKTAMSTVGKQANMLIGAYQTDINNISNTLGNKIKVSDDGLNYNVNVKNTQNLEKSMANALSNVQVVMDGENMGRFVSKRITKEVYK